MAINTVWIFGYISLGFSYILSVQVAADSGTSLTCQTCIPTFGDPFKCIATHTTRRVQCDEHHVCAAIFLKRSKGLVAFRGCAKLEETETYDEGHCPLWANASNFVFAPDPRTEEIQMSTTEELAENHNHDQEEFARKMLQELFPNSDPSRINRFRTPIKEMLTFYQFPETRVCVCKSNNCNEQSSSAPSLRSTSFTVLILLFLSGKYFL